MHTVGIFIENLEVASATLYDLLPSPKRCTRIFNEEEMAWILDIIQSQ